MKPSQFVSILGLMVVIWGSLFFTYLNQTSKTDKIESAVSGILNNHTNTINRQAAQTAKIDSKINDLSVHVDCLFNLAENPNHSSSFIANASNCQINNSSSGGATGSTKSAVINQAPLPETSDNGQPTQSLSTTSSAPVTSTTPPNSNPQPTILQDLLTPLDKLVKGIL